MVAVAYNPRPSYYARPYVTSGTNNMRPGRIIPHLFDIMEICGDETTWICTLSNRGDRLQEILKRGIPLDDARVVFYQMDG